MDVESKATLLESEAKVLKFIPSGVFLTRQVSEQTIWCLIKNTYVDTERWKVPLCNSGINQPTLKVFKDLRKLCASNGKTHWTALSHGPMYNSYTYLCLSCLATGQLVK